MFGRMPLLKYITEISVLFHWVGFVFLLVDFCVSGVPVRLLHFVQPLAVALCYNIALLIFSYVTQRQGPFYRVADYFHYDTIVSSRSLSSLCLITVTFESTRFSVLYRRKIRVHSRLTFTMMLYILRSPREDIGDFISYLVLSKYY